MSAFKDGMTVWITVRSQVQKRTVRVSENGTYLSLYVPGYSNGGLDCCRSLNNPDVHLTELAAWRRLVKKEDTRLERAKEMHQRRSNQFKVKIQELEGK